MREGTAHRYRVHPLALAVLFALCHGAGAQAYPPLSTTIAPDRPLLLFATPPVAVGGAGPAADHMEAIWADLPNTLRPYAVLELRVIGADAATRGDTMRAVVFRLQAMGIPVALRLVDDNDDPLMPLAPLEPLLQEFSVIRGIQAAGLRFNEYIAFGGDPALDWSAPTRWLMDAVDLAARYGRFITLHLDELHWLRIMANTQCGTLYDRIGQLHAYVIPVNRRHPPHEFARTGALMGAWIEGAVDHWGVEVRSDWYHAARFIEPGTFGTTPENVAPPMFPLRAMLFNGFMTGAEVYSFPLPEDLWYSGNGDAWHAAIRPTVERALSRGHIATKRAVQEKTPIAYRLHAARNPDEFHLNLRDLDPVYDDGIMIHGLYGVERAGQIPELVPDTGRYFWIPILSPTAPESMLRGFADVIQAGRFGSAEEWRDHANRYYVDPGQGAAFITTIGDTTFVMNTRENLYEEQPFRLAEVAAPVRTIRAERTDNGVVLSWPWREADLRYTVYRRAWPEGVPEPIGTELTATEYLDPSPLETSAAYSVAALTNECTDYAGTVGLGDYLVFDRVLSPLVEEVRVDPAGTRSESSPMAAPPAPPASARRWWPNTAGLALDDAIVARTIADRIVEADDAVRAERLDSVMAMYGSDYVDAGGWGREYARRAFQWFFEQCFACRMDRQIRAWDFSRRALGEVRVLVYLRFEGVAKSDAGGRFGDQPVWFPMHPGGETWLTWRMHDSGWQLVSSDPAVPNFKEILSFSSGPYAPVVLGPDR